MIMTYSMFCDILWYYFPSPADYHYTIIPKCYLDNYKYIL